MAALQLIKTVKNAKLYSSGEGDKQTKLILLERIRFSYPYFGTPGEDKKDNGTVEKKYRGVAMLPKATHAEAKDLCKTIITELMQANKATVPQHLWFLANGDAKADEKGDDTMRGFWLVSASDGKLRPPARNAKGEVIDSIAKIDEMFYGGCWGNMLIRPWFFDGKGKDGKSYPKRVVAGLAGVQFWKDDTPFGSGRIDSSDAWGSMEDDGDGDGMSSTPAADDDL